MNDQELKDYISKLPDEIRNFIYSSTLENIVSEISVKYSLNNDQSEILLNDTLLTLCLLINPENLINALKEDLGVSDILIEQIHAELESRVFSVMLSNLENKNTTQPTTPKETGVDKPKSDFLNYQNNILDKQKRFADTPNYIPNNNNTPTKTSESIVEKKLGSITSSNHTPLKYEKDPYREPLN